MTAETDPVIVKVNESLAKLQELFNKAQDRDEKISINGKISDLEREKGRIIQANIQTQSAQYRAACDALDSSIAELNEALASIQKVAQAIDTVAGALGKIQALIPA